MSIRQRLIGVIVLTSCSVVLAQTAQTKPPNAGSSSGTAISQLPVTPPADPCQAAGKDQAAILSDTMGVDFAPYMKQIVQIVKGSWYALMPPTVYPPVSHLGKVAIEFRILKEGKIDIDGMTVQVSSGDVALDRAARGSLIRADPFPPLPKEFPGQDLRLRFYFYYNLSPYIGISPCVDVRVASGSTLQFSASGKGITNTSVAWTVTGDGCSELACGTISDAGLYTAPLNIPIPPVVFVGATWRIDNKVKTKSRVTIVEANPTH